MAKKYYAVANGKEGSGIYQSWSQTEENIKGVSGVRFKAFPTAELAQEFLLEKGIQPEKIRLYPEKGTPELIKTAQPGQRTIPLESPWMIPRMDGAACEPGGKMAAYVDGSFRQGYSVYGYGVVIVAGGEAVKTISGTGDKPEYVAMRNVAGEVLGAVKAMQYALEEGASELVLYFDYQGIESWATGAWKRNNELTRGYHEFVNSLRGRLKITFCKVRGHSGDQFNDMADQLAKEAVAGSDQAGEAGGDIG